MKKLFGPVLLGFLVVFAVYVLALTVEPVRTMFEGTVFERFLPSDHDHDHNHAETVAPLLQSQVVEVAISPAATRNIGLDESAMMTVRAVDFYKSLTFPAVVAERPGFSMITVPSPVSGVVTKIHHESGVAVAPNEPLFDILLNQQELVKTQAEFLALLKKREINAAELERLARFDPLVVSGQRRELEYEKIKIDSEIGIQKNILLLQGLSEKNITDSLEKNGTIIRTMTVYAPPIENEENIASAAHADEEEHIFTVDELYVSTGKNIAVGDSLCRLTDYCKLAIRGKAFAVDEKILASALASKNRVSAVFERNDTRDTIDGLLLRSIDNKIDTASGTLFFYVDLKNRFTDYEVDDESNPRRYIQWHFKPGQRCELNVEVEPLPNSIVLPVDAVARDFQEMCVFEWVGNEDDKKIWRKKTVHVIYQTKDVVVIANDGALSPGAKIAAKGASFLLAALDAANQKTAGGGGIQHGDHVH
ncbi:MAG: efflux RND transporter periplasmic adaptor subunit [Planctomycetaceae bacterium]|nr:efflux RND transporter periplasmic adaptor subunit [Planctomycetaceae bacterium]